MLETFGLSGDRYGHELDHERRARVRDGKQGLAGIPTLPGLGPGLLERAHTADERVSLHGLRQAVDVYGTLARDFCQGQPTASEGR